MVFRLNDFLSNFVMSTQLIILISFVTLIMAESHNCGPNAVLEYNSWTVIPICNNPGTWNRSMCGASCVCKTNYVKNADEKCQPKKCPANSSFKICRKIDQHQCVGLITTNIDGQSAADCVCDPGHYWFNEFKGCMTLAKLLETYSYESRPRYG